MRQSIGWATLGRPAKAYRVFHAAWSVGGLASLAYIWACAATFPISWTRGMNIVAANFGVDPDIWGAAIGMAVLLLALLVIPFLDRGDREPDSAREAFNLRQRGWAFLAMAVFWVVLIVGVVEDQLTEAG